MINDAVGTKCIIDENISEINDLINIDISDEGAVYEVIRIIDGVPLFLEDHLQRMQSSIRLLGWDKRLDKSKVTGNIGTAIVANDLKNCNVKIVFYDLPDMTKYLVYISKSYYPEEAVYKKGVSLATLSWERSNPHAKRINDDYRTAVSETITKNNVFEALLVNGDSVITEGSRSNIFFIKDEVVYTAPKDLILEGITRKYVFKVCQELNIDVKETKINADGLRKFDGVFLSGTSIHVLPVSRIDGDRFDSSSDPTLIKIRKAFGEMVEEHIKSFNANND